MKILQQYRSYLANTSGNFAAAATALSFGLISWKLPIPVGSNWLYLIELTNAWLDGGSGAATVTVQNSSLNFGPGGSSLSLPGLTGRPLNAGSSLGFAARALLTGRLIVDINQFRSLGINSVTPNLYAEADIAVYNSAASPVNLNFYAGGILIATQYDQPPVGPEFLQ